MCSPEEMRALCRSLATYYDQVIIDCPAGIGPGFETAVAAADRALVVSTPDMVCARDAQILGHLLEERNLRSHLIINRLRPSKVMDGSMPDVDEIIDTAGIQLLGILPEDEEVAVANANARPLPAAYKALRAAPERPAQATKSLHTLPHRHIPPNLPAKASFRCPAIGTYGYG